MYSLFINLSDDTQFLQSESHLLSETFSPFRVAQTKIILYKTSTTLINNIGSEHPYFLTSSSPTQQWPFPNQGYHFLEIKMQM